MGKKATKSYSTDLKLAGVSIEMISEQLGHTSIKATQIILIALKVSRKGRLQSF